MKEYLRKVINLDDIKSDYELKFYFQIIGHSIYIELWKSKESNEFFLVTNNYSKEKSYLSKFNEEFKIMDLTAQQLYDIKTMVDNAKGILNYI